MKQHLLQELVRLSSIFPKEEKISNYVAQILSRMNFSVTRQPVGYRRVNILAQMGSGPSLLLFGHLDTVPIVPGWKTDPFALSAKGDRLYGLGTWDMKGGLAAILSAVHDFSPHGFTLKLAFVVDEENISVGMHTLVKSGWLSDVVGAVSTEPSFKNGHQGIALGRIGRTVYLVRIQTTGGHVYLSQKRSNAIEQAMKFLQALKRLPIVRHKNLGEFVVFTRFIHGGANAMSIPQEVELELEAQLVLPQTTDSVLLLLKSVAIKAHLQAKISIEPVKRQTPFCQPFIVSKSDPFVGRVTSLLQEVTHKKPVHYYRRSVADENRIAALGIPVVTVGPQGGNAHEPNEWVSKNSLNVIELFLKRLLSSYNASGVQ